MSAKNEKQAIIEMLEEIHNPVSLEKIYRYTYRVFLKDGTGNVPRKAGPIKATTTK